MATIKSDNTLQDLHHRIVMLLGWFSIPFILPFSINCYLQERYLIAVITTALVIIAVINSYFLFYKNRMVVPYWIYYTIKLFALYISIISIGIKALFWSYPFLFVIYFAQARFPARVMGGLLLITVTVLAFNMFEPETVVRYSSTLFMLMICCDVLVSVIMKTDYKLRELIIRDPLTDAHNRRHMVTCMQMTIEETRRDFGPASLIMLDIDHFKKLNDEYGHLTGDKALKSLVELLHKRQRKLDYVFRTGGEEFVLLLRNTGLQQALTFAENLREYIEEAEIIEGKNVTVSLGVAEYDTDESIDDWLHRADEYLYQAKEEGRNCVRPAVLNDLYE